MGQLTTHVLDTAQGIPAAGIEVTLLKVVGDEALELVTTHTNADGRTDAPLLEGEEFTTGTYELAFDVAPYFERQPLETSDPPFLDIVTVRFTIADADQHLHVPLLVSPWAYSTYRGS